MRLSPPPSYFPESEYPFDDRTVRVTHLRRQEQWPSTVLSKHNAQERPPSGLSEAPPRDANGAGVGGRRRDHPRTGRRESRHGDWQLEAEWSRRRMRKAMLLNQDSQ